MQNDLISREFSVKALRQYAEQKHAGGETELANGILKAVNFLQKEENVPTAYNVEEVAEQVHNSFKEYLDEIVDNSKKLDKVDFLLKQKKEICNIVRNGGKE